MSNSPDITLGIDVGTQSAKCVVLSADGTLHGVGQHGYDVYSPHPLWFEQDPQDWWHAVAQTVREALNNTNLPEIRVRGIGLTGQMHGVTLVDRHLNPLRPSMIWMDRRSADQIAAVTARVTPETQIRTAANRLSPGFAAASLAWLQQHEPDTLRNMRAALQPKDTLVLRLTGTLSSDHSDASATWLYDVPGRAWSETLASACGITTDVLPPLHDSTAVVGTLQASAAEALGLQPGIPVVAGSADQAALLLGAGIVEPGRGAITLATGGQVTVVSDTPRIDAHLRLNTFCHGLPERWYTMGAILTGGMALRWWRNAIGGANAPSYTDLLLAASDVPAGADGLIFLPYLEGERTPHMDPDAQGAFVGLTTQHTQAHITRAVLEGVAFAFRDCLETLQTTGPTPDLFVIGGGGSQGPLWRAIVANVLGVSLQTLEGREHTALGAAMYAGIGVGMFQDAEDAVARTVRYGAVEAPEPDDHAFYNAQFARFQALYPALRSVR